MQMHQSPQHAFAGQMPSNYLQANRSAIGSGKAFNLPMIK